MKRGREGKWDEYSCWPRSLFSVFLVCDRVWHMCARVHGDDHWNLLDSGRAGHGIAQRHPDRVLEQWFSQHGPQASHTHPTYTLVGNTEFSDPTQDLLISHYSDAANH